MYEKYPCSVTLVKDYASVAVAAPGSDVREFLKFMNEAKTLYVRNGTMDLIIIGGHTMGATFSSINVKNGDGASIQKFVSDGTVREVVPGWVTCAFDGFNPAK